MMPPHLSPCLHLTHAEAAVDAKADAASTPGSTWDRALLPLSKSRKHVPVTVGRRCICDLATKLLSAAGASASRRARRGRVSAADAGVPRAAQPERAGRGVHLGHERRLRARIPAGQQGDDVVARRDERRLQRPVLGQFLPAHDLDNRLPLPLAKAAEAWEARGRLPWSVALARPACPKRALRLGAVGRRQAPADWPGSPAGPHRGSCAPVGRACRGEEPVGEVTFVAAGAGDCLRDASTRRAAPSTSRRLGKSDGRLPGIAACGVAPRMRGDPARPAGGGPPDGHAASRFDCDDVCEIRLAHVEVCRHGQLSCTRTIILAGRRVRRRGLPSTACRR